MTYITLKRAGFCWFGFVSTFLASLSFMRNKMGPLWQHGRPREGRGGRLALSRVMLPHPPAVQESPGLSPSGPLCHLKQRMKERSLHNVPVNTGGCAGLLSAVTGRSPQRETVVVWVLVSCWGSLVSARDRSFCVCSGGK